MRQFCVAVFALGCLASPALAADPAGEWMVAAKTTVIRIAPCPAPPGSPEAAAANAFCGNVIWTKGPPGTDQNNPDPAKRSRSVIGLTIVNGMKPSPARNRWEGAIYNAENGKIYSGSITLAKENVLHIQGCVLGFLCGGEDWTRAKCDDAKRDARSSKRAATPQQPFVTSCQEAQAPDLPGAQ
ncbi:MAG: hypothetical protein JWL62_1468 [Hyphomicrobiales bacterium]|nr:hypothetical protein [Hyphomicrobiales bacterium]